MLLFPVSPPLRHLRSLVTGLTLAATAAAPAAPPEVDALDSVRAAVGMDFPKASAATHARNDGDHPAAEDRFNLAVVLLNEQPQSAAKLDDARRLFAALAADASLPADLRAASLYFHGRLEQTHARPVNPAAADALYARVQAEFPATAYAERAFVMQAVLRQYEPLPTAEKRARLLALDAAAETRLRTPLAQRLYHLAAGLAWSRLQQDDDRAYAHYLRVHELKLQNDYENSNLLVRLAELSRRRGDKEAALKFFHEFITRFPADRRTSLAREWIAVLEAKS
jgi:tetratricopeptide (TPR) repeat protein